MSQKGSSNENVSWMCGKIKETTGATNLKSRPAYIRDEGQPTSGPSNLGQSHNSAQIPNLEDKVTNDDELGKLLAGVTIAHGGIISNINHVLLPKKTNDGAATSSKEPKENDRHLDNV
ncbi:hypothetical protein TanjilG_28679 [Lupinus angustifolius]|uniref:Histone H2A C-terminal domain-containing protein n=1 Tax=Lupinus angustifolius TaxID=3871 RepID=A0A1J7GZI5_LUPAN|nr:hypothetical protein TanjilG_28679 [Lupinus angustifolius]